MITENLTKDQKKIENAYKDANNKALSILKGKAFKPLTKIPNDSIEELMEEFFGDKIKEKREEFKTKFSKVLEDKIAFDNFIKQKQTEFANLVFNKKKEFTKTINDAVGIIEGIDDMKKAYLSSLTPDADYQPGENSNPDDNESGEE